jgi:hypothetical protein
MAQTPGDVNNMTSPSCAITPLCRCLRPALIAGFGDTIRNSPCHSDRPARGKRHAGLGMVSPGMVSPTLSQGDLGEIWGHHTQLPMPIQSRQSGTLSCVRCVRMFKENSANRS